MTPPVPAPVPGGSPVPPVPALGPSRVLVAPDTILDARLALFHRVERWLAVADTHFGYELSQRAAGALFPLWGMDNLETRLCTLLDDYAPTHLVINGDFVHDHTAREPALALLVRLRARCEPILVAGNHDRCAFTAAEMHPFFLTERFCFHHGDALNAPPGAAGRQQIIGHHHPAGTISDGAGTTLKLPAFVVAAEHWILPAFSPWAAGGSRHAGARARRWLCSPKRILPPRA